jgi:steroid delta-isomerase
MTMQYDQTMRAYVDAFNRKDLEGILALFNDNAQIHSPTQNGPQAPRVFFTGLLERSQGATFALKHVFWGTARNDGAIHFDYSKPQADGGTKTFDCVDVFEFGPNGKIDDMRIIFDTKNLG